MVSKYKVILRLLVPGWRPLNHVPAIARIDRMGQTRSTEGMLPFLLVACITLTDDNSLLLLC